MDTEKDIMKTIPYNVSVEKLSLPEYGRNLQKMVDHCVTVEDREERTRCAHTIVSIMKSLFPSLVGEGGDERKLWDHLNIMSGFRLDIDFPCEVVTEGELKPEAKDVPYRTAFARYRNYGRNIQNMIKTVADMDNCVEKDQQIFLIANQMKKLLLLHNPENTSDARVFADIAEISEGRIIINADDYRLNEYIDASPAPKGKKKKK